MKAKFINENIGDKLISNSTENIFRKLYNIFSIDIDDKTLNKITTFINKIKSENIKISKVFQLETYDDKEKKYLLQFLKTNIDDIIKAYNILKSLGYEIYEFDYNSFGIQTYTVYKGNWAICNVFLPSEAEKVKKVLEEYDSDLKFKSPEYIKNIFQIGKGSNISGIKSIDVKNILKYHES